MTNLAAFPASADRRQRTPPLDSVVLGAGPFLVILAGAIAVFLVPQADRPAVRTLLILWSGAILAFIAGVRRGLTFDEPGGSPFRAVTTSLVLWAFAFAGLALPETAARLAALILGFAVLAVVERRAAHAGQAPSYFAQLRPLQATVAAASLLAVLAGQFL